MERYFWRAKIIEGKKDEYIKRHKEIWKEMKDVLTAAGVCNYSIWTDGNDVFGYYECRYGADFAAKVQRESETVKKWNVYMQDVMVMGTDEKTGAQPKLEEAFYFAGE